MALTNNSAVPILKVTTSLVVALGLLLCTNLCPGMERGVACFPSQPQTTDKCNLQRSSVPMKPSPAMPRTNSCAPTMAGVPGETPYFMGSRLQTPVIKPICGSAPVTRPTGQANYLGRSYKAAPYFAGNKRPMAPAFISDPSIENRNHCK